MIKKITQTIQSATASVNGMQADQTEEVTQVAAENLKGESALQSDESSAASVSSKTTDDNVIKMHEKIVRPAILEGCTYKIKPPGAEHAMYVTINDFVLASGRRRPFEIFINTKNVEHFHWIVALTRMMSAMFRKGGDLMFIIEELRAVFDPRGGHYIRGGKFVNSIVAEIADVIDLHMQHNGHAQNETQQQSNKAAVAVADSDASDTTTAIRCPSCQHGSMSNTGGCLTCLMCGFSKCD